MAFQGLRNPVLAYAVDNMDAMQTAPSQELRGGRSDWPMEASLSCCLRNETADVFVVVVLK